MPLVSFPVGLLAIGRLTANTLALGAVVLTVVGVALLVHFCLGHVGNRLAHWLGAHWLHAFSQEAARRARRFVFWLTLTVVLVALSVGVACHFAGHDVRLAVEHWLHQLTAADLLYFGWRAAALAGLGLTAWFAVRACCWLRPHLEAGIGHWVKRNGANDALQRWCLLLERFAAVALCLGALWVAGHVVGLGGLADTVVGFVLRVISIMAVARLLTLACGAASHTLADLGDRHLGHSHLHRYWERVRRLFPFGERCFEAAVYVSAASLCVRELHFITVVADFGPRVVQCIGIFFGTRVLIELVQVLLNEAFGVYDTDHPLDSKRRTLVPMLQSVAQYVFFFGSVVTMLGVLGIDTRPLLAGAGIVGLAGGLGAQSLIGDVVSGFFILFENQYLVGDFVQIGDAAGVVEAVGIRHTQIRDGQGKLYIIPNGQVKTVVSYSKGYVHAVVDLKVPAGDDLEGAFRSMSEAGKLLRDAYPETVLAETTIQGIVELGLSELCVRAVTRVQPGAHLDMQNEYRRLLKQVLDQHRGTDRTMLAA
jgi:small-conductance mechanosensitive channel